MWERIKYQQQVLCFITEIIFHKRWLFYNFLLVYPTRTTITTKEWEGDGQISFQYHMLPCWVKFSYMYWLLKGLNIFFRRLKFLNKYLVQNLVMNKDLVFSDIVKTVRLEGKLIPLIISLLKVSKRD